ncbi:AraC family transcriptional regulator [Paenibacillus sp.]|uniref:AraC family transcriptional regulator n=1 Tax=Paenibacillus sp. TaxID=58172 RepID=UPI002D4F8707|nr:AraC family transcriptional regulator [Paenibacillus sp.]HZG88189.1 AraC family transcriptional regulator [Paenibacillus sp.]
MRKLNSSAYMREDFPFWINRTTQGTIDEHGHDFVELVYVVRGRGRHHFAGASYDIHAGDVFIINPGETHAYSVQPGDRMEIINCLFMPSFIPDSLLRELDVTNAMDYFYVHPFLQHDHRFNHRLNLRGDEADHVLALLEGMLREHAQSNTGYATVIRLQLLELLILLSRYYKGLRARTESPRQQEGTMTARRLYGYMERNYDKKMTLQSLSELFNVSERHLNRLVRKQYGKSVVDVLHDIRIARAKRLLCETDEKIISIAAMVGYEDSSFFTRLFQRHVGCSPSQYRAMPDKPLLESGRTS